MGEKGVLKKGEEKECRKKASKIREFKNGWPVGRKFANFEGWGKLFLKTSGLAPMLS